MDGDSPTTLRDYAERFRLHVHCPACGNHVGIELCLITREDVAAPGSRT